MANKPWKKNHNPDVRPLGCNGKYGNSGANRHRRRGEKICRRCSASSAHYQRERRRGAFRPRALQPCGTAAAAVRHKTHGEELDFACRLALANEQKRLRARRRAESPSVPSRGENSPYSEGRRTILAMTCKSCGGFFGGEQFPLKNLGKRNQYRRRICNNCQRDLENERKRNARSSKDGLPDPDQAPA